MSCLQVIHSVANAVVSPPNWATLKSPASGQKNCWAGGTKIWILFIDLSARGSSFFFKFASFLSIQRFFEPFQCQEHPFHYFLRLRCPGEQSIDLLIIHFTQKLTDVNNLIVFPPNWMILIILQLKSTPMGNWAYDKYLILCGRLPWAKSQFAVGKKPICRGLAL